MPISYGGKYYEDHLEMELDKMSGGGILDWLGLGGSGKDEKPKTAGLEEAPPMQNYPTDDDVKFAKEYGFYQDYYEPYSTGKTARVLGQEYKYSKGKKTESVFTALSGVGLDDAMFTMPEKLSKFVEGNPKTAEVFAKGALAANRIPIAALGWDPSRVMLDTKMGPNATVAGLQDTKSDMMYVNVDYPEAVVHEAIHRGMDKLRQKHPDFFATAKKNDALPSEEMITRYLMLTQAGNPEEGRGNIASKQVKDSKQLFEGLKISGISHRYQETLKKLTKLAQDELGTRRGPK